MKMTKCVEQNPLAPLEQRHLTRQVLHCLQLAILRSGAASNALAAYQDAQKDALWRSLGTKPPKGIPLGVPELSEHNFGTWCGATYFYSYENNSTQHPQASFSDIWKVLDG